MLQPLRQNKARRAVYNTRPIPAPVGGLNAQDNIAAMPITDALTLDNFYPQATYCELRKGYAEHATGVGGATDPVETLLTYYALDGDEKLFGVSDLVIWDVTATGPASASYSVGLTTNRWQWLNFSNTAGTFLLAFSGQDTPLKYDGSAWATNSITGSIVSSGALINGFAYNERIFLCEKDTLDLWYLATQAISGTATKLPLGGVFTKGGSIIAGGSFSFDSGASVDDYLVAITSNGEAVMFTGTNPATDFVSIGTFDIGVPVGPRPIVKVGGDIIVITTKGAVPMSAMIRNDRAKADKVAVTAKIQTLFNKAVVKYGDNFGWEALNYATGSFLIINIPEITGSRQVQLVMNIITGAWCRFTNMNGGCWGTLNGGLYFGGNNGTTYHADYGMQDNGGQIQWDVKTAFTPCGNPGQNKFFKALRPFLLSSGQASFLAGVNVDYDNVAPVGEIIATPGSVGVWNVGLWSVSNWGGKGILVREWLTVGRIGTTVAARFTGAASNISVQLNGFDLMFETTVGTIY